MYQCRKYTVLLNEKRMVPCIQQEHNALDVACAGLGCIWKSVHTGSINFGIEIQKNGSFGCIDAVQTQKRGRNLDGGGCWIILVLSGRIFQTKTRFKTKTRFQGRCE
nr:MAG TPA: hypothetical protein [Caudoviricetes sp.]